MAKGKGYSAPRPKKRKKTQRIYRRGGFVA